MNNQSQTGLRRWRWSIFTCVALLFALAAPAANAAASLRTDHSTYAAGETVQVSFDGGPGNVKDWIGVYPEGVIPGAGTGSTQYLYVDGTGSGSTGLKTGTVSFSGLAEGKWVAYLLENDGYRMLARDAFSVVAATAPLVRADKQVYAKGEKITIAFNRGPNNVKDWIGIYAEGVTPGPGSAAYRYVDNTTTGSTAFSDGTVTFNTGLNTPGKWVAYLLPDDTYEPVAMDSFEIALSGAVVALQADHDHYLPGDPIKVSFDGGPGNPTDWVGIYRLGQRQGAVGSTVWNYVGGTQTPGAGLSSGEVEFAGGLSGPQVWRAFFMLNDAYNVTGETTLEVLDAAAPIVQTSKRVYNVDEPVVINFRNSPGHPLDWVGIYPVGYHPKQNSAPLKWWEYIGVGPEGSRTYADGLPEGDWVAYMLEDNGYTVLATESFSVKPSGVLGARVLSIVPANDSQAPASPDLKAILENRDTTVNLSTLSVKLDGVDVPFATSTEGSKITVTSTASAIYGQGTPHTYSISFKDSADTLVLKTVSFTIGPVITLGLPAPLFLENFNSAAEGSVPAGWTVNNSSDNQAIAADLGHLGSLAYANFTVVNASRLGGAFLTYTDTLENGPIAQILGPSDASYVINGSLVRNLADGRVLLGISGYHGWNTRNAQILEALTPTYDLSGKNDIYISFHSLLEQNQDSIAGIEVTTDGGTTWAPVAVYLDPVDIIKTGETVDIEATYNTVRTDIAVFEDGSGGTFGSFVKSPKEAALGAVTLPRINDDPADGTRVELFRVPQADNKSAVQFRLVYAGTDSWYFGVDNFGIYSIEPRLTITREAGGAIVISWPTVPGYVLQSRANFEGGAWANVVGVSGHSYTTTATDASIYYRLIKL